jgi:hypothetical protein
MICLQLVVLVVVINSRRSYEQRHGNYASATVFRIQLFLLASPINSNSMRACVLYRAVVLRGRYGAPVLCGPSVSVVRPVTCS